MSTISSVDTSFYPGLVEGFAPTTMQPVPAIEGDSQQSAAYYGGENNSGSGSDVDLSNYYNEVWQITTHDGEIVKYNKEYKTEYDEAYIKAISDNLNTVLKLVITTCVGLGFTVIAV